MVFIPLEFKEKIYQFIDDFYPTIGKGKSLQLYFQENENEETMIVKLLNILQVNAYSFFLKSLTDVPELSQFYIALKCYSA
ncbi:hypothetical protein H5410_046627 [Solanum commersonii]|uniref:Uncharacterized protein n=1 Tax=Solanum commersonii TaxID=4109 RepID=A0A9J5XCT2_SOLCO|nr:hypothetical protein H5410_046627 [Solanum commersonii]